MVATIARFLPGPVSPLVIKAFSFYTNQIHQRSSAVATDAYTDIIGSQSTAASYEQVARALSMESRHFADLLPPVEGAPRSKDSALLSKDRSREVSGE